MQTTPLDGVTLDGKYLLLKEDVMQPEYRGLKHRLVKATGGFGCSPNTTGSAVFTKGVLTNSEERWNRSDFEGIVDEKAVQFLMFMMPNGA